MEFGLKEFFFLVGWLIDWLVEEIFWRWWWEVFGFPLCF